MKIKLSIGLLVTACSAAALTPVPNDQEPVTKTYINATIHTGDGQVLNRAIFGIEAGKIVRMGHDKKALTGKEIDLQGKHIYPGFILTNTNLGLTEVDAVKATRDTTETGQLNPNIRSLTSFNTDSERIPTMRFNGILLAQTTPSGGLVSGSSSVVQLDAWNWEDAAVSTDDGLHLNWPAEWRKQFDFSTFTLQLKEDKQYDKKVSQIKQLFNDARADQSNHNVLLNSVKPVLNGERKLFIHSNNPKSIIESINYFKSAKIENLVLVTGQAAAHVVDFLKLSGVSVILESVHTLPQRGDLSIDSAYQLPAKLNQAGILTALSYPGSMSSRNLAFTAGTTVVYGNDANDALSMITLNAAKILGIDEQYGSLEIGKSATFFISDGDALDMRGNLIQEAYIDGRPITLHTRQQELYDRYKKKYQNQ